MAGGGIAQAQYVDHSSTEITPGAYPFEIARGPDGNLWFTKAGGDRVARITPAGVVTEFEDGISAGGDPLGIATGPDGDLWFNEPGIDAIGRMTPNGS